LRPQEGPDPQPDGDHCVPQRRNGRGAVPSTREAAMTRFLLWLILLVLCWPLALLALVLYPIVWLFLLPFRVLGIAVEGVLGAFAALIMLPVRILRGPARS
jgi:hypothetical protein